MNPMNRRAWLRSIGVGTAATAAGLTPHLFAVEEAEAIRSRVRTASEPSKLKITDLRIVRVPTVMNPYVIRLDTNQGISGYGEIRDGSSPTYALMLKSRLLGENPCHVDRVFRKIKQFGNHARQAGGVVAVEMAALASDLALSIHPHPTLSETLMEAAEVFYGTSTHVYRPKKKT